LNNLIPDYIAEDLRPLAVPIDELNEDPANARLHSQRNLEAIKGSLARYGQRKPVVANRQGNVVEAGNGTLQAARELGWTHLAVVWVDDDALTATGYSIADNRAAELATWDDEALARLLRDLDQAEELEPTGFSDADLAAILTRLGLETLSEQDEDLDRLEDDLEAADQGELEVEVEPGDVWGLGAHRLLCGDSTAPESFVRLLADERPVAMFTDPPYNVDYYSDRRPRPVTTRDWDRVYQDDLTPEEYAAFFAAVARNADRCLVEGAPFYVFNGHHNFGMMSDCLEALGWHVACVITWVKQVFAIGYGDYNHQAEFCLYGWKKGAAHRWYGPPNERTVWEIAREHTATYQHPTQKPVELPARALRNSTQPGDLVLEPFGGSGSTLVACEQMGRACRVIELDPAYCQVIVNRWEELTGGKAELLERVATT
jgi:DNA modification methylase